MITMTSMSRLSITTQEQLDDYFAEEEAFERTRMVNDGIIKFFEDLQMGICRIEPTDEVESLHLSKLTADELKLFKSKDPDYFRSVVYSTTHDDGTEIKATDSKSFYIKGGARRHTFIIYQEKSRPNQFKKICATQ